MLLVQLLSLKPKLQYEKIEIDNPIQIESINNFTSKSKKPTNINIWTSRKWRSNIKSHRDSRIVKVKYKTPQKTGMMDGKKLQPENIKATIIKCVIENRG